MENKSQQQDKKIWNMIIEFGRLKLVKNQSKLETS